MSLALYRGLTTLGGPLIPLLLRRRQSRGKEDHHRLAERRGCASRSRPQGPLVWIHAASIGESLSVLPLIERLLVDRPHLAVLVTTGTVTSAELMASRLPPGAFHQFVPVDRGAYVRRFLAHWRPDLVLWVESELWPNLVHQVQARGVPMLLVNGRISPRSTARWRWFKRVIGDMLSGFALCLAQTEAQTARFRELGAGNVRCVGNLKLAAGPLPVDEGTLAGLRAAVGGRSVWLAASTHDGEEEAVAEAHRALHEQHPDLLTMIVPRHPERGGALQAMLQAAGFTVGRRASGDAPGAATDIYLADTLGELGLFYRLADIVFVGGSLVPHGGHNLLEPAKLDCAVLHGPHMTNFRELAAEMDRAGAAREVGDATALAEAVDGLLSDTDRRRRFIAAGSSLAAGKTGILDAVTAELEPFLAALPAAEADHARA